MTDKTEQIASKFLGKKVDGHTHYEPSFLVGIPRILNRKQYDIQNEKLPFIGWDVWYAYEFSTMTNNGIPLTRVLKLKYSADSENLVESKSLKLYLNSFNMSNFGQNTKECLDICKNIIEKDLSEVLKTKVEAKFQNENTKPIEIFQNFKDIMDFIDEKNLKIENFKESPEILQIEETPIIQTYYLKFSSLRSNCRVTHQPDFGDAFIYYKSQKHILEESLIKYLSSFRCENHFHEECCEMIYKRLFDILNPQDELFIGALYTRRGGIDINPLRMSKNCSIKDFKNLLDISTFTRCGIKQ